MPEEKALEGDSTNPPDDTPRPLRDRRAAERTISDLHRLLEEQEFKSIDEANAFLRNLLEDGGRIPERPAETPLQQAQDIMYDAWDAEGEQRVILARQALEISPDCADAYVLLAEETAESAEQAHALLTKGVAAGERALGAQAFKEMQGHLWGMLEARPYLRARLGLARMLWMMDKREAAIAHYHDLLRLNTGDNQGVRYVLLAALLEEGHDGAAKKLLARFKNEPSAAWLYAEALLTFRDKGDGAASRKKLRAALTANPFVPVYLLGLHPLPEQSPDTIGFGDPTEAQAFLEDYGLIWLKSPATMRWLMKTIESDHTVREHVAEAIHEVCTPEERDLLQSQFWRSEQNAQAISVTSKLRPRLNSLPADWATGIAQFLGCAPAARKPERVAAIAARLMDKETLRSVVGKLSETERTALALILERGWVAYDELEEQFGSEEHDLWWWAETPPQSVIGRLRLAGFIFVGSAVLERERTIVAMVPDELRPLLREVMA